jgi:acetate kinase
MEALTLVANPGSASRKYALFAGESLRASLHFEHVDGRIVCTLAKPDDRHTVAVDLNTLQDAAHHIATLFGDAGVLQDDEAIQRIGLRIVAPSSYFLQDRRVDDELIDRLNALRLLAPLHINATLAELTVLREIFADTPIIGVSDSAFHAHKPDYAWNYGISLDDADAFDVKRFGYHGISVAAAVRSLHTAEKHVGKLIVCHLGSGASITAVKNNKSVDTTMGYSPLEGVVMSTRAGSIDHTAVQALKTALALDDTQLDDYLNTRSGLLGLGGSDDIRTLLAREKDGDHRAELALQTYVYSIQNAIGQMTAALGGVDMLAFTGTVGERSMPIRDRITAGLHYLDLFIDTGR